MLLLGNEALVLVVRLVPVAVLFLRLQLWRQLLENCLEQLLASHLVVCIAVPHSNLDCVPANRV